MAGERLGIEQRPRYATQEGMRLVRRTSQRSRMDEDHPHHGGHG
jgi:hypothetical protein